MPKRASTSGMISSYGALRFPPHGAVHPAFPGSGRSGDRGLLHDTALHRRCYGAPHSALGAPPHPVAQGRQGEAAGAGNRLTIAGLIFLLPAIVGVVFVITAFIFDLTAAVIVTGLLTLFFALLWFVLPLRYREGED
jgi:hypothetical protein